MAGTAVDLNEMLTGKDPLAEFIANQFNQWNLLRAQWLEEKRELRNYLFATDTRKTTNAQLPWKNSTTTPKLCQIRDNLHANYMSALFPNEEWIAWDAADQKDATKAKRNAIESYIRGKTRINQFRDVQSKLILDWIDYGNAFATTEYVDLTRVDESGNPLPGYVGPRCVRISPLDIVFNPLAPSFAQSPKIVRSLMSTGDLKVQMAEHPQDGWIEDVFKVMGENRARLAAVSPADSVKSDGFQVDGFGSLHQYMTSGYVELLEFYGNLYDPIKGELHQNHIITVADRLHIIRKTPNPSWRGDGFRHVGWRQRPDNLYSMGPLDNLVGMQYRIDHLENLKADVFDMIAVPMLKVKGFVQDFDYGPGQRIYTGDDGDVAFLNPDATALNADTQIRELEAKMEDLAGAPKNQMGIRTPGEKTAFEVQRLDTAAGRIFQNKITYYETQFLEQIVNDMLELARRFLSANDVVKVLDDKTKMETFLTLTKEDLAGIGNVTPVGARHFAARATQAQNLMQMASSALGQDDAVKVHISGFKIAQMMEELLDLTKFALVSENIRVQEMHTTQSLIQSLQQNLNQDAQQLGVPNGSASALVEPSQGPDQGAGVPIPGLGG